MVLTTSEEKHFLKNLGKKPPVKSVIQNLRHLTVKKREQQNNFQSLTVKKKKKTWQQF